MMLYPLRHVTRDVSSNRDAPTLHARAVLARERRCHRRWWGVGACVVAPLCFALTSCGSGEPTNASQPVTVTATVSIAPTEATTDAPDPTPTGSSASAGMPEPAGSEEAGPPPIDGPVVDRETFSSPTGNILCTMRFGVTCRIGQRDYDDLPRPADCTLDWSADFTIGFDAGEFGVCAGDTPFETATAPPLPYGRTSVLRGRACKSTEEGMTCWDTKSGHGFRVARGDYDLF
jgi:hypothetical protein